MDDCRHRTHNFAERHEVAVLEAVTSQRHRASRYRLAAELVQQQIPRSPYGITGSPERVCQSHHDDMKRLGGQSEKLLFKVEFS
jgi:hypothetical protein